jgi:carboxylesterase type B
MPAVSNLSAGGAFGPTIDFVELMESPATSARAGRLNNLSSAIIGTNLDEGRFLMPLLMPVNNGPKATRADLKQWLQYYYPGAVDAIATRYKSSLEALSPWETAAEIYTDSQYLCPTQRSARWLAEVGVKTFVYRLEYKPSIFDVPASIVFQESWCPDFSRCESVGMVDPGVGHSADVYLLFNDPLMNATDFIVGHEMVRYWMNFAGSGNPSDGNAWVPPWPTFLPGNTTMALRTKSVPIANLGRQYCDFWAHVHSGLPPTAIKGRPIIV